MDDPELHSGPLRKTLIYFGSAEPLPGDLRRDPDELQGQARTVLEVSQWTLLLGLVAVLLWLDLSLIWTFTAAAVCGRSAWLSTPRAPCLDAPTTRSRELDRPARN